MKSWKTPTPEQVDRAVALLGRSEQLRYFFDRLENPLWIEPLAKRGFFEHPTALVKDEKRSAVSFPPWPATRYLIRMAEIESAQPAVLKIALGIPDSENVRVHEDLADVASKLPAALASQLVPKAIKWLDAPYQLLLPEKLGLLVAHLARGGEADDALVLARALLAVVPDPREKQKAPGTTAFQLESRSRFGTWEYEEILKKHAGDLVDAAGEKALWLFCDLLESALRVSRGGEDPADREDYSWIWRPELEHAERQGDSVKDALVTAVREATERLARRDGAAVASLVDKLESRRWRIFQRLALHLLHRFPSQHLALVEEHLCDSVLLKGLEHEYYLLAKACFGLLPEAGRGRFLRLVEAGPDLAQFEEWHRERTGEAGSAAEIECYRKGWQQARLSAIADILPPEWKQRYDALVAERGEMQHSDRACQMSVGWYGPTSPMSAEDLQAMDPGRMAAFLRDWRPSGEFMAPSREGLGQQISSFASASPDRFAATAGAFRELDPVYVRSLLAGFREAVGQGRTFQWEAVLDLCTWVLKQPREIPGRKVDPVEEDPDWGWTRKAIAELLSAGLKKDEKGIPVTARETVWAALAPLLDDPDPTPDYEARYGGSNMDPPTLALNTTRGQAFHALIQYGLWLRRASDGSQDADSRKQRGFEKMPEMRTALERHLDPVVEPSLAIRSVYGQFFPWLALLDESWSARHAAAIFPHGKEQESLRDAAWGSYVVLCQPFPQAFKLLQAEYERAVAELGVRALGKHVADPQERLAEHLLFFYWSGTLSGLSEEGGLLARFFSNASDGLRAHAFEVVGRNLVRAEGDIEKPILDRLVRLWEQRLQATEKVPEQHSEELAAFGWWFASGKFNEEWAVARLLEVLRRVHRAEPGHLVVEKLLVVAQQNPLEAVTCLGAMLRGDREGWAIHGWRKEAMAILRAVVRSGNRAAFDAAKQLVDYLGTKGNLDFRTVLRAEREESKGD